MLSLKPSDNKDTINRISYEKLPKYCFYDTLHILFNYETRYRVLSSKFCLWSHSFIVSLCVIQTIPLKNNREIILLPWNFAIQAHSLIHNLDIGDINYGNHLKIGYGKRNNFNVWMGKVFERIAMVIGLWLD